MILDKQPKAPTTLIIFGATGDLMKKKVIPSLYHLYCGSRLPKLFRIVGVARADWTDKKFKDYITKVVKEHQKKEKLKTVKSLSGFLKLFDYQMANLTKAADYEELSKVLLGIDKKSKTCLNKLFYLAIPPVLHEIVLENLAKAKLTAACGGPDGWTRVIFEKPFGRDLVSAAKLNKLLNSLFEPEQLYLIDHYMGKEVLQNILTFRFANNFLEGFLNNKYVDKIAIDLFESIGVEDRGPFYETVGALRDVGQNHMLQMLALVTMDHPGVMEAGIVRKKRADLLQNLRKLSVKEIKEQTFRAQYQGYRKIKGVKTNSNIETYFKTIAYIDNPRWRGVPIYLQSGKSLGKAEKNITVYLKHQIPCLCPPDGQHYKNKIVFSLEPQEKVSISFQAKVPGFTQGLTEHKLGFLHRDHRKRVPYVEEYEKLLFDAIVGDQTLFISPVEMMASWAYIDPILKAWDQNKVKLVKYTPGNKKISEQAEQIITKANINPKNKLNKQLGLIGLGKMGAGLAINLAEQGWQVIGTDKFKKQDKELVAQGVSISESTKDMISKLSKPRLVWLMVPSGKAVDDTFFGKGGLANLLDKGDIIIDGGNSHFKNTIKRHKRLAKKGISLIDAGVSGGPKGARYGACIMVGGDQKTFNKLELLFNNLAVPEGVQFFLGAGAGHFVKMVHNGIEYGIMQSIAEGFTLMKHAQFKLDLQSVARIYNKGSVIESSLVKWLYDAFEDFGQNLSRISGKAAESGEGRWTVLAAKQFGVKTKVIEEALKFRQSSQKKPSYNGQLISAMRGQFGGHPVLKKNDE